MPSEAPTLYPAMRYRDAPAAIEFLKEAFGFERARGPPGQRDGTIAHAELTYGPSILMLGDRGATTRDGKRAGQGWLYVAVEDPDARCAHAPRGRARRIVSEFHDTEYGSRDYAALDPEGNHWSSGTYRPAVGLGMTGGG